MANPKHVALVRKGAEAIAEWRQVHPDERLDLSSASLTQANLSLANLTGADLSGANLSGASLIRVDLTRANLSSANLSRANLFLATPFAATLADANLTQATLGWAIIQRANLARANLTEADLGRANLIMANLAGADLSGASLRGSNLTSANLTGAHLWGATLGSTSLSDVDLSQVKGLTAVNQESPSSVGVDTLIASFRGAGNTLTPELRAFFRGAGVPQELLDALPKIISEIQYYSCFISYGQPDLKFAEKLREDLKGRGVDCWLYEKDKTVGKRTGHEIVTERRGAEKMVVLCSAKALIRDRFLAEIEDQINEEATKMVPISLDDLWKEPGFRVMRATSDLKPFLLDKN